MSAASGSIATTDPRLEPMTDGCDDSGPANIVGAGVAGLSVALALRQRGMPVRVLEQAPAITEVGAGLQISPNGTRVLRALGLDHASIGDPARDVVLHDARGRALLAMPLPPPSSTAPGFYLAHRADLITVLERAARAAGAEIRLLQQLETARSAADCVDLSFANGARSGAGLVIGADGLHSALRPVLNGAATPFFTGQVAWRALIPGDGHSTGRVQVFMGPGRHLVSYPLRGGALRNIVAVEERSDWAAESWSQSDDPAALRAADAMSRAPEGRAGVVMDARTGEIIEYSQDAGYRAVAALTQCVAFDEVGSAIPPFAGNQPYYPASLHLFTLLAQMEMFPACRPI